MCACVRVCVCAHGQKDQILAYRGVSEGIAINSLRSTWESCDRGQGVWLDVGGAAGKEGTQLIG